MKLSVLGIFMVLLTIALAVNSLPVAESNEDLDEFNLQNLVSEDNFVKDLDDDDDEDEEDTATELRIVDEYGNTHLINFNETLDDDDSYNYERPELMLADVDGIGVRSVQEDAIPKLYTKENPDIPFELTTVNGRDAPVNVSHPTNVLIHGWLEKSTKNWVLKLKDKFFINSDHNVIILDWQKYALYPYGVASRKTKNLGAYLGQVLISLIMAEKIRPEDIHLVGHSLGAHVAGIAAKTVKQQTGHFIGRITGLDPARPLFEWPIKVRSKKRLDKSDALFVDVIHSCGGSLGVKGQWGHADFYPNKGKAIQPGCGLLRNHICSHARGYKFFTESVNSKNFVALSCPSWKKFKRGKCKDNEQMIMGYYLDTVKASGKYYLRTKRRSPYGKGHLAA